MKEDKPSTEVLIAPQLAVQRYLDELLQDATLHVDQVPENFVEVADETQVENVSLVGDEIDVTESLTSAEKHQQQDDLVAQEIESEADIFAAFEFAVAALENESEPKTESLNTLEEQEQVLEKVAEPADLISLPEPVEDIPAETQTAQIVDEPVVEEKVKLEDSEGVELAPEIEPEATFKSDKTKPLPWAESRFECLLFNVGGLKMAVPLVELGGIQKADYEKVTKIFGQPNWFIGVSSVNDLRIRTVDTARWVMPNHYKGELHDSFKFIIQLDRSNWGLACEDVAEAISLEPSEVKWRSDRSKRPWLAGTVINHMCAILDVQGFIELLDDPINGFKAHLK